MAFIDVIKYEGSNDVLVFKHPITDFNTKAQLIVHENQEAIVFMNGEAKTVYPPGKHELKSDNRPGVKHIMALFSGGELANHCEVYFINKLLFSNIPWVTSTMDIQDATMQNYHSFWAQGVFTVRIANSYDLFQIIGTGDFFTTENLKEYFKERITSAAREVLSRMMNQEHLSYGEINSFLSQMSARVEEKIKPTFQKIGLLLDEFHFESVNMDKDTVFEEHRGHLGERNAQQIEGYTYEKKRMYDILEKQAENQGGSGAAASVVSGMGFGMGMGQVYGGMVGNAVNSAFGGQQMYGSSGVNNPQNLQSGVVRPHPIDELAGNTTCRNCHRTLQLDWNCCPYCGTSTATEMTCPQCGQILPKGAMYCPNCSTKIG